MIIDFISSSMADMGKYKMLEVVYKRDGKVEGKKLASFGAGEMCHNFFKTAQPGQYEVSTSKNDKGYWDWVDVKPATGGAEAPRTAPNTGANPTPRSTYETPEERAIKQRYIIKQSCLSSTIDYFALNPKKVPSVEEVLHVASMFEDHVYGRKQTDGIAELGDDVPL